MPTTRQRYVDYAAKRLIAAGAGMAVRQASKYMTAKPKKKRQVRRKYKTRRTKKTVKKQLKEIKQSLKSDQAVHTFRGRYTGRTTCAVNQSVFYGVPSIQASTLETAMANLRYYDPAVPGTLVTANASTGTYTRQVHFKRLYNVLTIRNNYQIPVNVKVYSLAPRNDTSIAPETFFSNGLTDQGAALSATSPILYPTDIDMFNANWRILKSKSRLLLPGREFSISYSFGPFDYDPSNYDSHSLSFQRKFGAHYFGIRLEGVLGHDTVADEQTTMQCAIDWMLNKKHVITYDAGVNLNDYYTDNSADASFTNGGVTSQVVVDNQAYSLA